VIILPTTRQSSQGGMSLDTMNFRSGAVAEWLGRGLQSPVQRFESAPRLSRLDPRKEAEKTRPIGGGRRETSRLQLEMCRRRRPVPQVTEEERERMEPRSEEFLWGGLRTRLELRGAVSPGAGGPHAAPRERHAPCSPGSPHADGSATRGGVGGTLRRRVRAGLNPDAHPPIQRRRSSPPGFGDDGNQLRAQCRSGGVRAAASG
jgi:hypothetical protein